MTPFRLAIYLLFVCSAIVLAWLRGSELFVSWYAFSDPPLPRWQRALLILEVVLLALTLIVVSYSSFRDPPGGGD